MQCASAVVLELGIWNLGKMELHVEQQMRLKLVYIPQFKY